MYLKDVLDVDKIQHLPRQNGVNSKLHFTPDIVVVERILSEVVIANDNVYLDSTTGRSDSSLSGVITI